MKKKKWIVTMYPSPIRKLDPMMIFRVEACTASAVHKLVGKKYPGVDYWLSTLENHYRSILDLRRINEKSNYLGKD